MATLTQADLVELNQTFEERTPQELLKWAKETFHNRVASLSAMQRAGSMVCHMIKSLEIDIPVIFVDTGVLYPETYETRDRIAKEYGLNVITLKPDQTMEEQTKSLGVLYLTVDGQKECCRLRKTEPLKKVYGQYDALIGSLRRTDGGARAQCPILAVDTDLNCLRVNPLAVFDDEQMQRYYEEHDVIINPLHEQGFTTIGCNRCTTPVLPNEPKRAGRWRHLGPWSIYCGINPTDTDATKSPGIELPQDLIDRILGRETDFMI